MFTTFKFVGDLGTTVQRQINVRCNDYSLGGEGEHRVETRGNARLKYRPRDNIMIICVILANGVVGH